MPEPTIQTSRPTLPVNAKLDKRLIAYVAAAGAAGVEVLAVAHPAQAKVVYTPANVTIAENSQFPLDLNQDGVNDFSFSHFAYGHFDHFYAAGLGANRMLGNGSASALHFGLPIGPMGQFSHFGLMAKCGGASSGSYTTGKWPNVQNRYLGLQFSINGKTHYGWARFTVTVNHGIIGTLTGYAYETIPNKRILAGQTWGTDSAEFAQDKPISEATLGPASLGVLARGADGLSLWRREEE